MTSRYKLLPVNADYVQIARICRDCIREMRREGESYDVIVGKINTHNRDEMGRHEGVSLAALKTFMSRNSVGRLNINNTTVELIYNFIIDKIDNLSDEIKAIIIPEWSTFSPSNKGIEAASSQSRKIIAHSIYALLCKWVNTSDHEVSRIKNKMSGKYVMLRKSVNYNDLIVRSTIDIGKEKSGNFISISHIHADRLGVDRESDGFIIPIIRNIYCILQVETGEGLEIIALKEPIQQNFKRMIGFLVSMNIDRKILVSHVFLEKYGESWDNVPPRFRIEDVVKNPVLSEVVGNRVSLLDKGTSKTIRDEIIDDLLNTIMNPN